jgi:hypothetical protein
MNTVKPCSVRYFTSEFCGDRSMRIGSGFTLSVAGAKRLRQRLDAA